MESLKKRLEQGKSLRGAWLTFPSTELMDVAAKALIDFVVIDLEHSHIDWQKCADMIKIGKLQNTSVIVRLGEIDQYYVKRALDEGAGGLIVPNIETREQLEQLSGMAFYPPKGSRGVGLGFANGYGKDFEEYYKSSDEIVLLGMIETKKGAENAEAIMQSNVLDGYLIGPYDLSASLGRPGSFETEEFKSAIDRIRDCANRHGMPSGVHVVSADVNDVKRAAEEGYKIICCSVDFMIVRNYYERVANALEQG